MWKLIPLDGVSLVILQWIYGQFRKAQGWASNVPLLLNRVDIVLHIRPDDIFRSLDHSRTFMQQSTLSFPMWEHGNTALERLDRVGIHDTFPNAGNEECGLSTFEFIIEVDEEGEQAGLSTRRWR